LSGTALVGHDVFASADSFDFTQGVPVGGEVDVPNGAASLQIRITDSAGQVVREVSVAPKDGTNAFTWDGKRDDGTAAGSGHYDIEAIAQVGSGNESLNILMAGRVASVTLDSTGTGLTLNTPALGPISLANVRRVM
jgi:flagellar basal-body rod modification protein FlgD